MSIKLSVIIPTYNRASYLSQCLHSILSSSYENLEVIVSDNASQDDTQAVVSSFTDNRLRYYRNDTNIGAELNILKLLEYVSGDYIFCLTDDDYLAEGAISYIVEIIRSHPTVGVIFNALRRLDARSRQFLSDYVPYQGNRVFSAGEESLIALVWQAQCFSVITIRRDLIDLDGFKRHIGSMYPQVYLVGSTMKRAPTYYTDARLVIHRRFNEVAWEYKEDYMLQDKITMVRDLLPNSNEECCLDILIRQAVENSVRGALSQNRSKSMKAFLRQALSFLAMPEVRRTRVFWVNFCRLMVTFPVTVSVWRWIHRTKTHG